MPRCLVPEFGSDVGISGTHAIKAAEYDVILLTQSCDLEQRKVRLVACCPICTIGKFEAVSPAFTKKGRWNDVLKGRIEGLHLLASPTNPENNREAMVVDFREIYSLPINYLEAHVVQLGPRWRLQSPYLEHFSQAFARFFMRVGLPSTIPAFS